MKQVFNFEMQGFKMADQNITAKDIKFAKMCVDCKLCSYARKKQKGLVFFLVSKVETKICPCCKAFEKVYGRKASDPL